MLCYITLQMTHTYMINEAAADCSGRKTDYETVSYRCVDDLHHGQYTYIMYGHTQKGVEVGVSHNR